MKINKLDKTTLKQAVKLKVDCWPEQLAGKLSHHLNEDDEYRFW